MHKTKWLLTLAGGGISLGLLSYFEKDKKFAENSWTTNFIPSVKWDYNWDRRETLRKPKALKSDDDGLTSADEHKENSNPTATRHLFFVRHGQYDITGSEDDEHKLTSLGRYQAECTGKRLKELNFKYSVIVQSTMMRARETAALIKKHLVDVPLVSSEMLCEGAPIPPEPPIGHFRPEMNFFEDGARIEAAFRKYFHRASCSQKSDSFEIFVCHANVIRYFICRALQFPPEAWLRFSIYHGSITWFSIHPSGRVVIQTVGDCGHIPGDKLTKKFSNNIQVFTKVNDV